MDDVSGRFNRCKEIQIAFSCSASPISRFLKSSGFFQRHRHGINRRFPEYATSERSLENSWGYFSTEISALRALNAAFFILNSAFASRHAQFIEDFRDADVAAFDGKPPSKNPGGCLQRPALCRAGATVSGFRRLWREVAPPVFPVRGGGESTPAIAAPQ